MATNDPRKSSDTIQKTVLYGIPVISIMGGMTHFLYELSGESKIIGLFAPVNESVWEHLKMSFWILVIYWIAAYFFINKKKGIGFSRWLLSCTTAAVVSPAVIVTFFYTYTGALGIESVILDVFSLFLGVAAAQLSALHVYRYAKLKKDRTYISACILIILAAAFIAFTFLPPRIPLFQDSLTGAYGI